jgi:hypothetical protein
MNWKDIYTKATSFEREQILHLLTQRLDARAEQSKMKRQSIFARLKSVVALWYRQFRSPRSRVHWIVKRVRPARPHRAYILLTFALALLSLEPYEYAVWSIAVGGATSCMVTARSVYWVVTRKCEQWEGYGT